MTVVVVLGLAPSCVSPSEANPPVSRVTKGLAAHMQPVEAGEEEEEGAEGVEEGDGGVEEVAGQHGGQGQAEERGGQDHVEGGLDEEAGEAGEDAEEDHDAEEGDGGSGGDCGEVEEAGGDCLEQLGDVGSTTRISTGVTIIGLWRRLLVTLTLIPSCRVCSAKSLTVLLLRLRSWWSGGLLLCRPSLLLDSWNGLQTKGTQKGDPWGRLL